jgi:hypothetical protein
VLIAIVLFLSISFPLLALDEEIAGSAAIVAVESTTDGSDTVRRVILSSIAFYLDQEGLVPIQSAERELGDELSRSVRREAQREDAEFVLQALSTLDGADVTVDLSLYLVESGERLSRATTTEEVGLTLDRAIAGLTGNVLQQARSFLVAAAEERREQGAPPAQREGVLRDGSDLARSGDGSSAGGSATSARGPAAMQMPDRFLAATVLFAPMVPVEDAATYFNVSYGATLAVTSLPFASDAIGLGLLARAVLSEATGAAASARALMVPFGVSARFSSQPTPFATFFRLTGGASLFYLENETLGTFAKIIPYGAAELGMRLELGALALVASASFEAFFEDPASGSLLLGFSPGIGVSLAL